MNTADFNEIMYYRSQIISTTQGFLLLFVFVLISLVTIQKKL
jgi:hypothetical protein